MTVGDGKTEDYRRGYTAGYQDRVREEVAAYFEAITAGQQVYDRVIKGLVDTPTYLERKAARVAVLREGHAAELHVGQPVLDCPVCQGAVAAVSTYGPAPVPNCRRHGQPMMPGLRDPVTGRAEWHCVCSGISHLPVGKPHSGHYGVPAGRASLEELYPDGGWPEGVEGDERAAHSADYGAVTEDYVNGLNPADPVDTRRLEELHSAAQNPAYGAPLCTPERRIDHEHSVACGPMRTIEHECLIKDGRCLVKGHDV